LDISRPVRDKFKHAKFKVHKPGEGKKLKLSLSDGAKLYLKNLSPFAVSPNFTLSAFWLIKPSRRDFSG